MGSHSEQYNVLILGETQSGKSTFIECARKYANPDEVLDLKKLGTGFTSCTIETHETPILTDLPEHIVRDKDKQQVNYGEFIKDGDEYDFEDSLNKRSSMTLDVVSSRLTKPAIFNLIDTPGLNATKEGDDEKHVQKIFKKLIEVKTIHLLIITISSGPFTQGLQDAIKNYVDMFPDFNGIIAFVHTHFDYKNFHPNREKHMEAINLRTEKLHDIMGRLTFPHFKIDCDVYNKKPIRQCITNNAIQKVLELATFNSPVDMLHTVVNKTRKMRDIDNILQDKFQATSRTIERTLRFKDRVEGAMLSEIYRRETDIHQLEAEISVSNEYLIRHDSDRPEVLHEERHDLDYQSQIEKTEKTVRFPPAGTLEYDISNRELLCHNVIYDEEPSDAVQEDLVARGAPWRSYTVNFHRTSPQHSVFHTKIYTAKRNLHSKDIEAKRQELVKLEEDLELAKHHRDVFDMQNGGRKERIKAIVDSHREGIEILRFVSNKVLSPLVFEALMDANAYKGDPAQCSKNVEKVYMRLAKEDEERKVAREAPSPTSAPKLSVLVLGKTQAGKTAFIEHIKRYTKQDNYVIDKALLGDGTFSKTETIISVDVKSTLPAYEVYSKRTAIAINRNDLETKFRDSKDEEGFRNEVYSCNPDWALRQADKGSTWPENVYDGPSLQEMEFEFLDTPGLCNHEGKDGVNATNVVKEIVAKRTFNLILVVVNPHDELTGDLVLALHYYANVLGHLRSNIAFVYTHVEYVSDPSNITQAKMLGSIFRGSTLPQFTINLTENQAPIFQCKLRNTIRDILSLVATTPSASVSNVSGQIEKYLHPSQYGDEYRQSVLKLIYENKHSHPVRRPSQVNAHDAKDTQENGYAQDVNILLIGDTLSGKTCLMEALKKYSTSRGTFTDLPIVNENTGQVDKFIKVLEFRSSLQVTKRRTTSSETGKSTYDEVDLKKSAEEMTYEDYEKFLDDPGALMERRMGSTDSQYLFKVYDAPGISSVVDKGETSVEDWILSVYFAVLKTRRNFHHILVALAPGERLPVTTEKALTRLLTNFPNMRKHISFVHTKVDYLSLHPSVQSPLLGARKEMEQRLEAMIEPKPPFFIIDSCVKSDRPNRLAITQNKLHDILVSAVKNRPDYSVYSRRKHPLWKTHTGSPLNYNEEPTSSKDQKHYSVLLLGKTQAGKSTLIKHIKQCVDINFQVRSSARNAEDKLSTIQMTLDPTLPAHEHVLSDSTDSIRMPRERSKDECIQVFSDIVCDANTSPVLATSTAGTSAQAAATIDFTFIDTPGLNDTDYYDTKFADQILDAVVNVKSFNMILVVVSARQPLTTEFGFALEYYSKVLQEFRANIVFLHTHVDNAEQYVSHISQIPVRTLSSATTLPPAAMATTALSISTAAAAASTPTVASSADPPMSAADSRSLSAMLLRQQAFSAIFHDQQYLPLPLSSSSSKLSNKVVTTIEEFEEAQAKILPHKHFVIDLVSNRPKGYNGLIQDTIRMILQKAMKTPPTVLDVSPDNIKRIRELKHPDVDNEGYHRRFREAMEAAKNTATFIGGDVPTGTNRSECEE
ncbi:hypothetical protein BG004_002650 [Podila humilis]|nr:hypothetical protein BG004_002650 [Podila humilis]